MPAAFLLVGTSARSVVILVSPWIAVLQNLAEISPLCVPPRIVLRSEAYTFYINLVVVFGFEFGEEINLSCHSIFLIQK